MPQDSKAGRDQTFLTNNTPQGNNYLLAIGIDAYQYCSKLRNCTKDAQDFIAVLQQRFNFDTTYTDTLYNTEATRKNILKAFRDVQARIQPTDNLVVYFSGHGDTVHQLGYWIPVEAKPGEEDEYISAHEIVERLNAIPTFHTFLIVDACFSGTLFQNTKNITTPRRSDEVHRSRWGLTASHSRELALDGTAGDNSPFAECLLVKLRQTSEALSVHDLSSFVINEVRRRTRDTQTPIAQPLPVRGHELGQFVFHLKKDENRDWAAAQAENTIDAYKHFLTIHPAGDYKLQAIAKIAAFQAEEEWQTIKTMQDEKENQVLEKLRAIHHYLSKITVNTPTFQAAEDLGEYLNYKHEFLKAFNYLFALRRFARQETPFQVAAEKRIAELEADLRQGEQANEHKQAAEIRRQAEEKAAQTKAERKRQTEQQQEAPRRQEQHKNRFPPLPSAIRKRNDISSGIAFLGLVIVTVILIKYFGGLGQETTTIQQGDYEPEMIKVTGGTFTMGCKDGRDTNCYDEEPAHSVTIKDFSIGKYEVTQAQWRAVMDSDPTELYFKNCDQCPVENVSWNDIQEFLKKLNSKTNKIYRLPTEAEWEYAARGGKQTNDYTYAGGNNADEVAWYTINAGDKTYPVGQKKPNELGLYDMSGNVWEWCSDWYDVKYYAKSNNSNNPTGPNNGTYRVLRGGSCYNDAFYCQVAIRYWSIPFGRLSNLGFRLAQD